MKPVRLFVLLISAALALSACKNKDQSFYDAVMKGDQAEAVRLLDEGADINATNKNGKSALMEAIYFSHNPAHFNLVKLLIDRGVDVNIATHEYGTTALFMAVELNRPNVVKLLLENGADVNAQLRACYQGKTALMIAADSSPPKPAVSPAIFEMLIDYGADIDAVDTAGETALSYAQKKGRGNIIHLLQ